MVLEEVVYYVNKTVSRLHISVAEQVPAKYQIILNILFYTILIAIYAIFVYKFYKFLARRDILKLNLNQYNRTEHPFFYKLFAALFFFLEYIIILPIIVFFWFMVLAVFLLLFSKSQSVEQIILVSAAIVAAVRMTSYFSVELSRDLAKLFPFTVLAVFLLEPDFFIFGLFLNRFSEVPFLLNHIFIYLIFIIFLEIILRGLFTLVDLFTSSSEEEGGVN